MPKHYPGAISYLSDSKFERMSVRNALSYVVLAQDPEYTYLLHPGKAGGFVFLTPDLEQTEQDILPVMRVSLRETPIKGYRQAHYLRIRNDFGRLHVATNWYMLYAERCQGVVSDREHLEGGKLLWRSLIDKSLSRGFKLSLVDLKTGAALIPNVTAETSDPTIWSHDAAMIDAVLVMEADPIP